MEPAHETSGEPEAHVRELAHRHSVRYDVLPESQVREHEILRVGFDLQFYGVHEHPKGVTPGCQECVKVYSAMHQIAEWVLPTEYRPSRYEIEGYDRSLHVAPDLKNRDEVLLKVKIVHRHEYFEPIDKCEERCLSEMKQKLARLGVREGCYRPSAGH